MKKDYDDMYEFTKDFENECLENGGSSEEYKYIKRIIHPECPFLYKDIFMYRKEESYFFDYNGDWYGKSFCKNPLGDCEKDAMQEMDYAYKEAMGKIKDEHYANKIDEY